MRRCKVGIIGCGVISRTYASDIRDFYKDLELAACADVDPSCAKKLAAEFGIPCVYTAEELLKDPQIEIVINLTPPQIHVEMNRRIIEAGKHLFSEKPFAPTLLEAQELLALAKTKNVRVGCAPDTFLCSGLQSLRWYLDAGLIGKPFFVTANMTTFGPEIWHPNPAPFYREGAGPVMDMAPYYLSAIVALLGSIESIAALRAKPSCTRQVYTGIAAGSEIPVETPTHYSAVLRLRSGAVANLNVSFDIYRSNLPMLEIYGDAGTLSYPDPNFGGGTPKIYRKEQYIDTVYQSSAEVQARSERFFELPELLPRKKDYSRGIGVQELAHSIAEDSENRTGGGFILHITEALEGIRRSAESGAYWHMRTDCKRPQPLGLPAYAKQPE